MSTYRADSEISRVNAHAAQEPVTVSQELFALVQRAIELSATTNGAFDITYDSVGALYDYRARLKPSEADIVERLESIDFEHIKLDAEKLQISFSQPGLDSSGRRLAGPAARRSTSTLGRSFRQFRGNTLPIPGSVS